MWTSKITYTEDKEKCLIELFQHEKILLYSEVVNLWQTRPRFCTFFNRLLSDLPFEAMYWETPPVTRATFSRPFECVIGNHSYLAGASPQRNVFSQYFKNSQGSRVVTFLNLGRDATLVAPCPLVADGAYAHLMSFVRKAPKLQQDDFWKEVGRAVLQRLGNHPLWLNTEGSGVHWLHVRLDSQPKYYHHKAYKEE